MVTPKDVAPASLKASALPGGGLLIEGVPASGGATIRIEGSMRSDYYPEVIETANLALRWFPDDSDKGVPAMPARIDPPLLHVKRPASRPLRRGR